MAFPDHYSQVSTAGSFNTSLALTMPTAPRPEAGMLLTAYISGESVVGSDTATGGTGQTWTGQTVANNGGGEYLRVWKAIALGGGADALTVSGGGLGTRQAWVCATSMWDGTLTNVLYVAATTSTLNAPNLAMGASRDHLFYAFARNNNNNITGAPTTPGTYTLVGTPIQTGVVRLAVAYRQATVTSEDPGAFQGTASAAVAGVIGIRPGSSGPPPTPGHPGFMQFFMQHNDDDLAARRAQREWKQRDSGIYCRDSGLVAA